MNVASVILISYSYCTVKFGHVHDFNTLVFPWINLANAYRAYPVTPFPMTSVPLLSQAMMNRSNALLNDPRKTHEAFPEFTFSPQMTFANSTDLNAAAAIPAADAKDKLLSTPSALKRVNVNKKMSCCQYISLAVSFTPTKFFCTRCYLPETLPETLPQTKSQSREDSSKPSGRDSACDDGDMNQVEIGSETAVKVALLRCRRPREWHLARGLRLRLDLLENRLSAAEPRSDAYQSPGHRFLLRLRRSCQ